jgi:hypothetical protein
LALSFGVGYTSKDPGDALLARRVFVNDNTDETPDTSGRVWDLRLDVIYVVKIGGLQEPGVFAGVRRSMFTGRFIFVDGNEDFEVVSDEWG